MRLSIWCAVRQTMNAIALACCSGVLCVPALNQWLLMRRPGTFKGVASALHPRHGPRAPAAGSASTSVASLAQRLRQARHLGALLGRADGEQLVERLAVAARQ